MKKTKLDKLFNILFDGSEDSPEVIKESLAQSGYDIEKLREEGAEFVKRLIQEQLDKKNKYTNRRFELNEIKINSFYREQDNWLDIDMYDKLTNKFICRLGTITSKGLSMSYNVTYFINTEGDEEDRVKIIG